MKHAEAPLANRAAIAWVKDYLLKRHDPLQTLLQIKEVPWSSIYRIETARGRFYLKRAAEPFAIEIRLLPYLSRYYPASVPQMIASHAPLNALFMLDAGEPLRLLLQKAYDLPLVLDAIERYTHIQVGLIAHVDELISCGVLDWRLSSLPKLYLELLNQKETLLRDGLSRDEIESLLNMYPHVVKLCDALSTYKIPATIEHGDFHDNNVLVGQSNPVINDWGDAVITHPFFSLTSWVSSMRRNHLIDLESASYTAILDHYLQHWMAFEPMSRLKEAFYLVSRLSPIKFSLSFYRITLCGDTPLCYRGYLASALKQFMHATPGKSL